MVEANRSAICFLSVINFRSFKTIFVLEMWDFWIVSFAISIKVSVNRATGSSNRASSSDNREAHRVRKDIQSALSDFQCSAAGSSSLAEVLITCKFWSMAVYSIEQFLTLVWVYSVELLRTFYHKVFILIVALTSSGRRCISLTYIGMIAKPKQPQ